MKYLDNTRGVTILELMLALSLLAVVLAIGYNLFAFTNRAFTESEKRTVAQRDIKFATDVISDLVKRSSAPEFIETVPSFSDFENDEEDDFDYLFLDNNSSIVHFYKDDEGDAKQRTIIDGSNSLVEYEISFAIAEHNNDPLDNVINITVRSDDVNFQLSRDVLLLNVDADDFELSGGPSSSLKYQSPTTLRRLYEVEGSNGNGNGNGGGYCFIASAAFSTESVCVDILRTFRDTVLLKTTIGQRAVDLYYLSSPPIAQHIESSVILKKAARVLLVPFIVLSFLFLNIHGLLFILIVATMVYHIEKRRKQYNNPEDLYSYLE